MFYDFLNRRTFMILVVSFTVTETESTGARGVPYYAESTMDVLVWHMLLLDKSCALRTNATKCYLHFDKLLQKENQEHKTYVHWGNMYSYMFYTFLFYRIFK
ncbi:hypothetical protein KP509_16G000300 [Ceratopteris richardii]|uniref:Secreted protein n=1 Tax=Ceratopteris richardii TaxID=49495 RepID=A0A8T2T098_CERRI|nr:hypothetical protein KP509_16G000300 [Ceratopteris richardii]